MRKLRYDIQGLKNSMPTPFHASFKVLESTPKNVHANFEIPVIPKFLKDISQKCFTTGSLKLLS